MDSIIRGAWIHVLNIVLFFVRVPTWSLFRNVYVCKEEYGDHAFEKLQIVAFVLRRKWKFVPYGPWEYTPKDMPHDVIDVDDQDCPPSSSSSAARCGPRAGTNQEEEEGDSCEEFANPTWEHEYTNAQARKTCSSHSVSLPHMA